MDFELDERERHFRDELRSWLAANLPEAWQTSHPREPWTEASRKIGRAWQERLARGRFVAVDWPEAWGGRGASVGQRIVLQTELLRARAPRLLGHVGLDLVGPALLARGSEAQRRRFLERMRTGEELWCQGFSEPGAGSDLASLATRAVRRGDAWVVDGQKVWTSIAEVADWCFLLARTDPSAGKHAGISALLVDMRTPGITVRPLRQMSGEAEFNEVFFADVHVPAESLLGAEGDGWKIAMDILGHERGPMWTFLFHGHLRQEIHALLDLAQARGVGADAAVRQRLAALYVDVEVLRLLGCRSLTALARGESPGPRSSLEKLFGSELAQRLRSSAGELLGPDLLLHPDDPRAPWRGRFTRSYLHSRADTIMGGPSEIQRTVIARQLLKL